MVHTLSICSLSAHTAPLELGGAAAEAWPTGQVVSAAGDEISAAKSLGVQYR